MKKATLVLATSVAIFFLATSSYAATRKIVNHGQTNQSVITGGAVTGTVSFPSGMAAYFGQDYVDQHSAGTRFNAGDNPGGSSTEPKVKVTVKPVSVVNKAKVAAQAVSKLKSASPVSLLAIPALEWAIEQLPGATFDPLTGQPVKTPDFQPSGTTWQINTWSGTYFGNYSTFKAGCDALRPTIPNYTTRVYDQSSGSNICRLRDNFSGYYETFGIGYPVLLNCPNGFNPQTNACNTVAPAPRPFDDSDFAQLESTLSGIANSEWLRGLIKANCEGALNPGGCFDSMVEYQQLVGPNNLQGKTQTTTTTTQNPDGTTSTVSKTSTPTYSYTYGSNFYDYKITMNTITNNNGQTTNETTTTETPPDQEPDEEPKDEEEEQVEPPTLGDPYEPVISKYNDIKSDVSSTEGLTTQIPYGPWYSFGSTCQEIQVELPVYGMWSTVFCPIVENWVRPILAFLFAVFTWQSCHVMVLEALRVGRPI